MEEVILNPAMGLGDLFNTVRDNYLHRSEAEMKVKHFLQKCCEEDNKPVIYYTGHGQAGTGDWCFQDGTLSIHDIEKLVCGQYPLIIVDCCYSGHWADYCHNSDQTRGFHTLSAAPEYSVSYDHPDGGGELTQWITGKGGRPSTEPLYSAGSHIDYIPDPGNKKIDIEDFVLGYVENTNYTVISQTMTNHEYGVVFAVQHNLIPRPHYKIRLVKTIAEVMLDWKITSMSSNNTMISVFYLDQPCDQILVPLTDHPKYAATGYTITTVCCNPRTSDYYCAMVLDNSSSGHQVVTTHHSLDQSALHQDDHIITSIAQSSTAGNYLVVMTQSAMKQVYRWWDDAYSWYEERTMEGYSPTLVFRDMRSDRWLCVMTADNNISETRESYGYLSLLYSGNN